jgi:hypothetical protein
MDIVAFLVISPGSDSGNSMIELLQELRAILPSHDMIPVLLKTMKYVVDTLRSNNVVWGVGRGSSV